jgi:hypothetical protein
MELKVQRLDELLDRALHNHGAVEPRIGLEGRVLARLRLSASRCSGAFRLDRLRLRYPPSRQ